MASLNRIPRLRAAAIVEWSEGIILVGTHGMGLLLPGGGVHPGEDEATAAIRELAEETTLVATRAWPVLRYESHGYIHSTFLVEATGTPVPANEIDKLVFYQPGSSLPLAPVTRAILDRIAQLRRTQPQLFSPH
jgi:8-oxo-dGTP pyrophosphatase MutT (NUDIX family)